MKLKLREPVYQCLMQIANQADASVASYINNLIEQHIIQEGYNYEHGSNKEHRSR